MNDICIVSVGVTGRESYAIKAAKLKKDVENLGYSNFIWIDAYPPNSPSHHQINFAFKAHAIQYALSQGYKKILWLDSVAVPIKKMDKINSILDTTGYFFVDEGFDVGSWCKDEALPYLNITRENSFNIPQVAGKHFGLNFNFKQSHDFFSQYFLYATVHGEKVFHGSTSNTNNAISNDNRVRGHRHDQIVASVICHNMKFSISSQEMICWANSENWTKNLIDKNSIELLVV
jgi:hypothetical protein